MALTIPYSWSDNDVLPYDELNSDFSAVKTWADAKDAEVRYSRFILPLHKASIGDGGTARWFFKGTLPTSHDHRIEAWSITVQAIATNTLTVNLDVNGVTQHDTDVTSTTTVSETITKQVRAGDVIEIYAPAASDHTGVTDVSIMIGIRYTVSSS